MKGMSYKKFYTQMINNTEIEFSYQGIDYMFTKEPLNGDATSIELSIWSGEPLCQCCFKKTIKNTEENIRLYIDNLVNLPIFPDNKSIKEARNEIEVICIFG